MATNYTIRPMESADVEETMHLFLESFGKREPLVEHLQLPESDLTPFGRFAATLGAQYGLSLVCCESQGVDQPNRIIGFRLSLPFGIHIDGNVGPISALLDSMTDEWIRKHPEMSEAEMKEKVVYLVALGVREGCEGKGIGRQLVDASLAHAKKLGKTLAVVQATAGGSQKIFNALGFSKVVEKKYSDFEYEDLFFGCNIIMTTFTIRPMTIADVDGTLDLFVESFSKREPLGKHLHLTESDLAPFGRLALPLAVQHGLSLVCCESQGVDKPDRIIGFRMSLPYGTSFGSGKEGPISALLGSMTAEWVRKHPEMSEEEMKEKVVYLVTLGVREGCEGRGIGKQLVEASLAHAKKLGKTLAVVQATAGGSQKIFNTLGFTKMVEKKYADFEYNGKKIFEGINDPSSCITYEKYLA